MNAVYAVDTPRKLVALTFDDGPDPAWTPRILATLRGTGAKATFFVLGPRVQAAPQLVRDEVRSGDEVECHGWDHRLLLGLAERALVSAYSRCAASVRAVTGASPALMRPPYGIISPDQVFELRAAGFVPVLWDVNGLPGSRWATSRLAIDMQEITPGAVILLHDGGPRRDGVLRLLPRLLEALRVRGYQAVTLRELLAQGSAEMEPVPALERRLCLNKGIEAPPWCFTSFVRQRLEA